MPANRGAIEVSQRLPSMAGERPRSPDPRPERAPPEPAKPAPEEEEEDGDIATPKRDRDDEAV